MTVPPDPWQPPPQQRHLPPQPPPGASPHPWPGHPAPPAGAPRRRSPLPWLVAAVTVLSLLCCAGGVTVVLTLGRQAGDDPQARPRTTEPAGGPGSTPAEEPAATPTTPTAPAADTVLEGRGNEVVELSLAEGVRHTATITYRGGGNFVVWALDGSGERDGLVVNDVGRYTGVRPIDFERTPAALRVESSGSWRIVIRAFAKTPPWNGRSSGRTPTVLRLDPAGTAGPTRVALTHTGRENFVVVAYDDERYLDLLVNDIGRFSGEVAVPAGTTAIAIEGDGSWTIQRV